jgi:hypothetical protein
MDCGFWTLLPCCSHPSLVSLPLLSTWPTPLLRLGKCHHSWGCLPSLSWSRKSQHCTRYTSYTCWGTSPLSMGTPGSPVGHSLRKATQAGDTCPWEPIWVTLPPPSLSLSLSCSPSLFSFPPPRVRAWQSLQLILTKRQLDNSALLAWVT